MSAELANILQVKKKSIKLDNSLKTMSSYIINDKVDNIEDIDGIFTNHISENAKPHTISFNLSDYPNSLGNTHLGSNVSLNSVDLGLLSGNDGKYMNLCANIVEVNANVSFDGDTATDGNIQTSGSPISINGWSGKCVNANTTPLLPYSSPSEYIGNGGASISSWAVDGAGGYGSSQYTISANMTGKAGGASANAYVYANSNSSGGNAWANGGSAVIIQADSIIGNGAISSNGGYSSKDLGGGRGASASAGGGTITIFTKSWSGTVGLSATGYEDGTIRLWKINNDGTLTLMANNENGTPGATITVNSVQHTPLNGGDFTIAF